MGLFFDFFGALSRSMVGRGGGARSAALLPSACVGACLIGFAGFAAGFFGPIIFTPEANQGPLLGIFITGPLGAVLGAIGGAVVGWRCGRSS